MTTFRTLTDAAPPLRPLQAGRRPRVDLLTWPVLGPFLKWRHARLALQIPVLLLAGLVLFDGFLGPQLAPKNLATTSVWLESRGLVALGLLIAGNFFCMACPFMLPRRAGRWLREHALGGGRQVPRFARNKWLAAVLLLLFFYSYEQFSLWASPWLTAWVAAGYFLVAFVVDTTFRGAAFCKYVCPLGQFNFFGSLVSPLEIKVRAPDVCTACQTKDCIAALPGKVARSAVAQPAFEEARGGSAPLRAGAGAPARRWTDERGCEMWLFQPAKVGNMDCTFCLDCVHACPHDNIGLIGRLPGRELWDDPYRSGVGRLGRRRDLTALLAVLVFAAFGSAFAMIKPVYALRDALAARLGLTSAAPVFTLTFLLAFILLPSLALLLAGLSGSRLTGRRTEPILDVIGRFVPGLVPLGAGMWLAHYGFHFMTGALTIVPVAQSFLADVGLFAGTVNWGLGPLVPLDWLFPIEAIFLYLGAFGSLVVTFQIARLVPGRARAATRGDVLRAALTWVILCLLLLGFGLWVMLQPMDMRGTMLMSGLRAGG